MLMLITTKSGFGLRVFEKKDAEALAKLANDLEIYRMTLDMPHPYELTDALDWIAYNQEMSRKFQRVFSFAIISSEGSLAGSIGRRLAYGFGSHQDEVGYWVGAPYRGRGIMTEILPAYVDHLLNNEGLSRVSAFVFPDNTPSIRLLERCGFVKEGYLHHYLVKDRILRDTLLYAIWKTN